MRRGGRPTPISLNEPVGFDSRSGQWHSFAKAIYRSWSSMVRPTTSYDFDGAPDPARCSRSCWLHIQDKHSHWDRSQRGENKGSDTCAIY